MYNFINNCNFNRRNIIKQPTPKSLNIGIQHNPYYQNTSKTISLFSQPYLDTYNKCYKNIVVTNLRPMGPLNNLVRVVNFPPLSEFKQSTLCSPIKNCGYALMSLNNTGCGKMCGDLMLVDEIPNLISYLSMNGYMIDTSVTKMFNKSEIKFDTNIGNKLICFITYNG